MLQSAEDAIGSPAMVWLIVILVLVGLLVVALITLYNRFVRLRNRVDNSWAQIEVQLKRRWT